jgi:hypothetical protein
MARQSHVFFAEAGEKDVEHAPSSDKPFPSIRLLKWR